MAPNLPAGSRSFCDTRPPAAVNKRPSGRSRSPRIDPSTITSPAHGPWTQISPGAGGAIEPTLPRNHSTPGNSTAEAPGSDKQERNHALGLAFLGQGKKQGAGR